MSLKNYEVYYSPVMYFGENDIEKESLEQHKKYSYHRCPVWNHQISRIFIVKSPVDFEVKFSKTEQHLIEYKIGDEETKVINLLTDAEDDKTFGDDNFIIHIPDVMTDNPVIQLPFTNTYFWTSPKLEYVWFEFLDHPMTSLKNNFIPVGGWFNLANYPRNTSLGIKVIDVDKPVSVKKGDPLYRVRFYSDDLDEMPVLVKKEPHEFPDNLMYENVMKLRGNPELLPSILFHKSKN